MAGNGLVKLIEECGELSQIAAKKMAYPDVDDHPDGKGSMKLRMEEEIADVIAACGFISEKFNLDSDAILKRATVKHNLFNKWDKE